MSKLALHGGEPVRKAPPPEWPIHDDREAEAAARVARSGKWQYATGTEGTDLESEFAEWIGAGHAISTINGTETMVIALKAAGVGPGDEVIMPTTTFVACPLAALLAGAVPVPVDIDQANLGIDPEAAEAAVTDRTRVLMPVHLGGIPADLDAVMAIAERHDLVVLEDTAQAQGTEWKGQKVGSIGDFGSFSFQTAKTMVSGDGGMITTNDAALADLCRSYRQFGNPQKEAGHSFTVTGGNYRMSEFVAAVLRVQLSRVHELIDRRTGSAEYLDRRLGDLPGILPTMLDERVTRCSYLSYSMNYDAEKLDGVHRDVFLRALSAEGISVRTGYTTLVHEMALTNGENLRSEDLRRFTGRNIQAAKEGAFPNAENARSNTTMWMRQNFLLGDQDVLDDVVRAVHKVVENIGELRG
ncbi:MAG: DegT/DnrJ/EryC1/StrS family aminotransferase [Candidatus Latescibacteria bacterium]|jgi:dTDP-4-amino-4,6-dideoxygalactose transaminase|nr:DegT/DnrJ/EryC1/StrS family aminotransferase [Candidatus Latescibacterota bacterium]